MNRVGIGIDVHRFAAGRKLIIGGVEIPHPRPLDVMNAPGFGEYVRDIRGRFQARGGLDA